MQWEGMMGGHTSAQWKGRPFTSCIIIMSIMMFFPGMTLALASGRTSLPCSLHAALLEWQCWMGNYT